MLRHNPAHQGGQFKYYPMLDRAIARILRVNVTTRDPVHSGVMRGTQFHLGAGNLSRRMAELHVLRFLMCESEARHGR